MASSSSSSPLATAFSSQSWKYDVFLSFRGEDTRKNFVDHLYSALVRQGIDTYKDDVTLHRGESIDPSLMKAIVESRIAIIVFSENYADSSWCLDELTHIMKCRQRGQIVMPIFYNVDPSHVQMQKEKYGEVFVKHELENKNKVESWRKALIDASNLSGWETKNIANGHESKGIREIVEEISLRLQLVTSIENGNLVGIEARMKGLKLKLQIGSGGVCMVGIWGVGGGGKTTLASSVYDEICSKFDGCCFLDNVREESRRHGLGKLKDDILLKMEANNIGGGRSLINRRFRHRKVLLVLDDVDHLDQLEALAGSLDWFGEGSRVIITTRDEHLLKAHKVVVHNISLLNGDEAIELFRKHAHLDYISIMEDYEQLSKEVVSYAGGLPLALKVLGSFLCDKSIEQWRSALARLKEIPDTDVHEKLKISFDGLTKVQKDLFLNIACFFNVPSHIGLEDELKSMEIFDACGYHPVIGMEELRQKALISINSDGFFNMHHLVQEMGHYIVRGEHPNNPAKHSRIWKQEDVLRICAMDATTELDMIEAIRFKRSWIKRFGKGRQSQVFPPIVANMKNLRWIDWEGDVSSPLPANFPPRDLCCLILDGISQKQLWEGYKYLPNLKMMELWNFEKLIMTPNFDGLPSLEKLTIFRSPNLEEIDASLGCLEGLVCLSIEECPHIKKFPSITRLKKLDTLSFKGSPGVFELLCYSSPHNNVNHIHLCFSHKDLRKLDLSSCNLADEYMSSAVWELPNLQQLDLLLNDFSRLNFGLMRIPRLKSLNVSVCRHLVELSGLPSSIAVVKANTCSSLESLGDISHCKWLWKVIFHGQFNPAPLVDGGMLVDSMLKGNAIEDHFINVALQHQLIQDGDIVGGLFRGNTFTLRLPHDWYSNFCGFLIHFVTYEAHSSIDIIMKEEEVGEDCPFELSQESNEASEPKYGGQVTYVGYVSFGSLRRTACWNSTYNLISFSLRPSKHSSGGGNRIGAVLVPRKTKNDALQTTQLPTNSSQFWDKGDHLGSRPFTIKHDSKSSINIEWRPYC